MIGKFCLSFMVDPFNNIGNRGYFCLFLSPSFLYYTYVLPPFPLAPSP